MGLWVFKVTTRGTVRPTDTFYDPRGKNATHEIMKMWFVSCRARKDYSHIFRKKDYPLSHRLLPRLCSPSSIMQFSSKLYGASSLFRRVSEDLD